MYLETRYGARCGSFAGMCSFSGKRFCFLPFFLLYCAGAHVCDVLRYETDARVWLEIVSDWNVFLPFFLFRLASITHNLVPGHQASVRADPHTPLRRLVLAPPDLWMEFN